MYRAACFAGALLVFLPSSASAQSEDPDDTPVPTICDEAISGDPRPISIVNIRGNHCKDYDAVAADRQKFIIDEVNDKYTGSDPQSPAIYPGPPAVTDADIKRRHLTDPDNGQLRGGLYIYAPPEDSISGNWTYRYFLNRVSPIRRVTVLDRLAGFRLSKMYHLQPGVEKRTIEEPYVFDGDYRARYVCAFDLSSKETLDNIYLGEWIHKVAGVAKTLWAECSISTDEQWHPTRDPTNLIQPIALETTSDLYLFSVEIRPQWGGGGNVDHFDGRVFDLSRCFNPNTCYDRVMTRFTSELATAFAATPLAAARETKARPPGQIRFKRAYQTSEVLRGFRGPYYELSTYTLFAWQGPNGSFLGGDHRTAARLHANDPEFKQHVFLQISQALEISVGADGSYEEPKPQQYDAYTRAVAKAVEFAVERTARAFKGQVVNGVGIIPR